MNTNCPFCGMPALDGEPCCNHEFQRKTMRAADYEVARLRSEIERLRASAREFLNWWLDTMPGPGARNAAEHCKLVKDLRAALAAKGGDHGK